MKYEFANIKTTRAIIGDRREQIVLQTFDFKPDNVFSTGEATDKFIDIATLWAAVEINPKGLYRMLGINTTDDEVATHIFYTAYFDTDFLEARYIVWNSVRYRVLRAFDIRGYVQLNYQIAFPCILKGDENKKASTW